MLKSWVNFSYSMKHPIDYTDQLTEDRPELNALEVIYAISKLHLDLEKSSE